MKLKHVYLFLSVLSVALTFSQLIPFMKEHGGDMVLLFRQGFETYGAGFLTMDLLGVALAATVFIVVEGRRLKMRKLWLPIVSIFAVGISLALPMFLYMREIHLERNK
jgi:hypothetical protein